MQNHEKTTIWDTAATEWTPHEPELPSSTDERSDYDSLSHPLAARHVKCINSQDDTAVKVKSDISENDTCNEDLCLKSDVGPMERLFELAIRRALLSADDKENEWTRSFQCQLPKMSEILQEMFNNTRTLKSARATTMQWMMSVCSLETLRNESAWNSWLQGLRKTQLLQILRFFGYPSQRSFGLDKLQDSLNDLSVAVSQFIQREAELRNFDISNLDVDSFEIVDIFYFNSMARYNAQRGFVGASQSTERHKPCRFCHTEVPQFVIRNKSGRAPPESVEAATPLHEVHRSKQFCNKACLFLYKLASGSSAVRDAVRRRDRGICSVCGLDTLQFLKMLRTKLGADSELSTIMPIEWRNNPRSEDFVSKLGLKKAQRVVKNVWREAKRQGLRPGDLWQADHIVPVTVGGGTAFTPLSFRTLCTLCHQRVTQRLRVHIKAKPKALKKIEMASPTEGDMSESVQSPRKRRLGRWYRRL